MATAKRRIAAINQSPNFSKIGVINEKRPQLRSFLHINQEFKEF
jgi:hypothetical protein